MDKREAIRIIDATLRSAGYREVGPGFADYEGKLSVHGKEVDIRISIPSVTFVPRPQVHLLDRSQVPVTVLAHVERETGICYSSAAGLPVDLYEPGQAVLRVLEEARLTLERSYGGRGRDELIDEYQSYWRSVLPVYSFIPRAEISGAADTVTYIAKRDGKAQFLGLSRDNGLPGYECTASQPARIILIDGKLGPVENVFTPKTLDQLQTWFLGQPGQSNSSYEKALKFLLNEGVLFFAAENAFLGLEIVVPTDIKAGLKTGKIRKLALAGFLKQRSTKVKLLKFSGKWASLRDVVARNAAMTPNLSSFSIALVGCGTIGGYLARLLAQSGAGSANNNFLLVDPDVMAIGNLGRHILGFTDLEKPKAQAVSEELSRLHPSLTTSFLNEDVMQNLAVLSRYDLIIDATGDWNVQSALNAWFMKSGEGPKALLHSWIFMNGAGVQSFLNMKDEYACFRCLKTSFDGRWRYPAGDEHEELNLKPATCGDGAFVPFPSDVSTTAAAIASRAALEWAAGKPGPRLRTLVTDLERGQTQKPRYPTKLHNCPACLEAKKNC